MDEWNQPLPFFHEMSVLGLHLRIMMAAFKVGQCFLFSVLWRSLCTTGVLFFGFWLFFLQCLEAFTEEAFGLEIVTLSPWDLTVMLTGIFISEVEQLFIC